MTHADADADTETLRLRDTETLRHRDTETPRHRDTETPRHRDTETPRHRDTETPRHPRRRAQAGEQKKKAERPTDRLIPHVMYVVCHVCTLYNAMESVAGLD